MIHQAKLLKSLNITHYFDLNKHNFQNIINGRSMVLLVYTKKARSKSNWIPIIIGCRKSNANGSIFVSVCTASVQQV